MVKSLVVGESNKLYRAVDLKFNMRSSAGEIRLTYYLLPITART